ncbi:hypothetical protein TCAL_04614 [Tigriopus californicus]|uniref:Uncharacterized protein n=1 Tax=Tigriopus californicus TaxID=6832 RepID=A0A553PAC6_TIGCA|nr:uncharacterized protein LOC131876801 [Tigriopus californicus]TRY74616.1 hypothetical protein TCAL_04614 [Tigriopus californicus]|eukprot:TCALIF_04614-PA protein Name:"Protein of unknown function" AED:0.00 eAED:0.00 QI:134/1/1/1/0.33/0.5/4/38/169
MVQALKAQSCNGQYNECSTDESNQAFTKKYRGLPLMPEAEAASMIERKGKKITLKKHITAQIIPWGDEGIGGIGTWTITRNDKEVDEGYRICSCDGTQEKSLSTGSVPNGEVKPITTFFYQFKNDQIRNLNNKALTFDVLFTDDCSTGRCRQSGRMRCTSGKNDPCFRV